MSRESFPREQDHLLLIGDQDRQRWVGFSEDLKSFAAANDDDDDDNNNAEAGNDQTVDYRA